MILYSGPVSMFDAKAQIALAEKVLAAEVGLVPFGLRWRYEPKHPEVLRISPKGQVPVLIDDDIEISDSTQIFEYLEVAYPEPPLWPGTVRERTLARQLEHVSGGVFVPKVVRLMSPTLSQQECTVAAAAINADRDDLESRLANREYLVGAFSYADIAFVMAELFAVVLGAEPNAATPRLNAWRRRVAGRPAVSGVVVLMARYMSERGMPVPDFIDLPSVTDQSGEPEPAVLHDGHAAHRAPELADSRQSSVKG